MIRVSDANPIQFWLNGVPSFNSVSQPGIDHVCFHQPWNEEDEITLQFTETDLLKKFVLQILSGETVVTTIPFTTTGATRQLTFIPNDYGLTGKYKLKIIERSGLVNETFVGSLTPWTNTGLGENWVWQSGPPVGALSATVQSGGPSENTKVLTQSLVGISTLIGTVSYRIEERFLPTNPVLSVVLLKNNVIVHTVGIKVMNEAVGANGSFSFNQVIESIDYNQIGVWVDYVGPFGGGCVFIITSFDITDRLVEVAVSDLIDIQAFHTDTRLIKYSNRINFAGLVYTGISPTPEFGIRVRSKFYEERWPEENESEPDGAGNVDKLSSTTKTQKLFETDPLPPYMHKKIKLALQHNTVYIENQAWVKEEPYETEPIERRYPFFYGSTFLTLKNDEYIINLP